MVFKITGKHVELSHCLCITTLYRKEMDVPDTEHESKDKVESVASGGRGLEESDADLDQLLDCKFKFVLLRLCHLFISFLK